MVKSNAQRQAEYQRRQQEAGSYRLDAYISADARDALEQLIEREGCTRKEAIERSIFNEAKGRDMQTQFRTDDPATDPGGRRSTSKPAMATIRLTAEEVAPRKPVSQPATRKESSMTTQQQKPARMTADEAADLEQFKTKLINDHLDAREVQANGGPAGVAHKARINAMLDANNQHRQK